MADILKDTEKAIIKAEHLVAGQYGYLKEVRNHVNKAKEDTNNGDLKSAHNHLANAKRLGQNYVGRGEAQAARAENDVMKDLLELAKELPADMRDKALKMEKRLQIEAETLEKNLSRYTGSLKEEMTKAQTEIQIAEKGKDIESAKAIAIQQIDAALEKINDIIKWIAGLITDLKFAEQFEKNIEAWVQS